MSEGLPNLTAALVAAMAEMPAVKPDASNPHFKSEFASLDHLIAVTRPVLTKHGLVISQFPTHLYDGTATPTLLTRLAHVSGEFLEETMPLLVGKNDMQGLGSAITYARRYAWAAVLGISAEEDDDGNQASRPSSPPAAKKGAPQGGVETRGAASPPEGPHTPDAGDSPAAPTYDPNSTLTTTQASLLSGLLTRLRNLGAITDEAFVTECHRAGASGACVTPTDCVATLTKDGAQELIAKLKTLEKNAKAAA